LFQGSRGKENLEQEKIPVYGKVDAEEGPNGEGGEDAQGIPNRRVRCGSSRRKEIAKGGG